MKFSKLDYLVIFLFVLLVIIVSFYFINKKTTIQQQISQLQQELQQLEEKKKRIEQIDTDRLAEDISSILLGTYFSTSTDIEVEGVEIINKGDRKLVINHQEGYQIEIPGNLILNQSRRADNLRFYDLNLIEQGFMWKDAAVIYIYTFDPNDPKNQEYVKNIQENLSKNSVTTTTINGEVLYKYFYEYITEGPEYASNNYYLIKPNKLYEIIITMFGPQDVINTFKLIK